jgi:hypothetical protein
MMLGHCFVYDSDDGFRTSSRVIPLAEPVPVFFGREGYLEVDRWQKNTFDHMHNEC